MSLDGVEESKTNVNLGNAEETIPYADSDADKIENDTTDEVSEIWNEDGSRKIFKAVHIYI